MECDTICHCVSGEMVLFSVRDVNVTFSNTWATTHSRLTFSLSFILQCAHPISISFNRITHSSNCCCCCFFRLVRWNSSFVHSHTTFQLGMLRYTHFMLCILFIRFLFISCVFLSTLPLLCSTHFSFYHCLVIRDFMFLSKRFTINLITLMLAIPAFTLLSFF